MVVQPRDRRFAIILNPRAGIGPVKHIEQAIARELRGLDFVMHEVAKGEDIRGIARKTMIDGATDLLAAGGDGTVSGVAGAVAGSEVTMGIIPTGTANMLARELGIPMSPILATRLVRRGLDVVKVDAMATSDRCFVYQVVIGTGTEASSRITDAEKKLLGPSVYAMAGLRLLTVYHPIRLRGRIDGKEVKMWANQVIIANAGLLGIPSLRLGPDIRPDDAKIDLIAMRGRTRTEFIGSGLDLVLGNYEGSKGLRYFTARQEIMLESEPPSLIKADGEFIGRTPLNLKVRPGAVRIYAPGR